MVLGRYEGGARSLYCVSRPIKDSKDLAGTDIRVQQSEIYIEIVGLLGARPVPDGNTEWVLGATQPLHPGQGL